MDIDKLDRNIQKTLLKLGYNTLLPVQKQAMEVLLRHQDCLIQSCTGSGKTAAYCIPIIQNLKIDQKDPQALILAPTRELALQIQQEADMWGVYNKVKSVCLIGKQPFVFQKADLAQRCHIVIGTPGRVLNHLEQGTLKTEQIQYVVIDEADKMLDQNFKEGVERIVSHLPDSKTMCFVSATMDSMIKELASQWMKKAQIIINTEAKVQIKQYKVTLYDRNPFEIVLQLLIRLHPDACMLFCQRQSSVDALYTYLRQLDIRVERIHAGLSQTKRIENMEAFRSGDIRVLIASDVASRGIDIEKVPLIINVDRPESEVIYTHRIGRSGRAHEKGMAITLIHEEDPLYTGLPEFPMQNSSVEADNTEFLQGHRHVQNKMEQVRKGIVRIYLNTGKRKKIRAKDIVGALCGIEGINPEDIGVIRIQDHQSYVDIFHGKERLVLKQLKKIKNKCVKAEVAHS